MIRITRTMSQRHRCRVEKGDDSMEAIEKMVQEALDSTKSAHKRIDRMEKRQDNLEELTNAFSVLQNEQEHIKTDVGEIKDDVKQLVSKPAKRWDGLIDKAIAVVVGAAIGFLLNVGCLFCKLPSRFDL